MSDHIYPRDVDPCTFPGAFADVEHEPIVRREHVRRHWNWGFISGLAFCACAWTGAAVALLG